MFESYNRLTGTTKIGGNLTGGRFDPGVIDPVKPTPIDPLAKPDLSAASHPSLEQAAEFFQVRGHFLSKIRTHLEKMRDLARSNAERKVDKERSQAFDHHACTVRQITATDYNGAPLFAKGGIVAQAAEPGNQLVMEGLDLSHPAITSATESSITSKESAGAAGERLDRALQHLTVVESVLEANLSRLGFLKKRVELVA